MDNILKIFVRVNSGGTILSKTDLLFSTIVANWEAGRDEIEKFIVSINKRGDGFNFTNDFVMRSCLMLTDCPVLFKVGSFKTENVIEIKNNWQKIKEAINKTVDLLVEYGFNGSTLPSLNAVIPIAYYIMKGGELTSRTKNNLNKFLLHCLLKNIFSGQGDTVLENFRNFLREEEINDSEINKTKSFRLKNKTFSFDEIVTVKLPSNKTLKITDDDINDFLDYKKGNSAFLVLSFLYPNLRYNEVSFDQDHIHPASKFTDAELNKLGIPVEKQVLFQEMKDKLPNLQLLERQKNREKSDKQFKEWLFADNGRDIDKFLSDNYIDNNQSLEFSDFENFFNLRKAKLETKLKKLLK